MDRARPYRKRGIIHLLWGLGAQSPDTCDHLSIIGTYCPKPKPYYDDVDPKYPRSPFYSGLQGVVET